MTNRASALLPFAESCFGASQWEVFRIFEGLQERFNSKFAVARRMFKVGGHGRATFTRALPAIGNVLPLIHSDCAGYKSIRFLPYDRIQRSHTLEPAHTARCAKTALSIPSSIPRMTIRRR